MTEAELFMTRFSPYDFLTHPDWLAYRAYVQETLTRGVEPLPPREWRKNANQD